MNCDPPLANESTALFNDAMWLGHLFPGIGFILIAFFLTIASYWEGTVLHREMCFRTKRRTAYQLGVETHEVQGREQIDFLEFAYFTTGVIGLVGACAALGTSQGTNWNHAAMLFSFSMPQIAMFWIYNPNDTYRLRYYYLSLAFAFAVTYIVVLLHGIVHVNTIQIFMHDVLEYGLMFSAGLLVIQALFFYEYSDLAYLIWLINIMLILANGIWFILIGVFVHTEQGYINYIESCNYHQAGGHFGSMLAFGTLVSALWYSSRSDLQKMELFNLSDNLAKGYRKKKKTRIKNDSSDEPLMGANQVSPL